RADIADHADDLHRHAAARDQQCLSNWVLIAEQHLCTRLADDDYVWVIHEILLVEVTPGQQRNAESVEPSRHEIIRWRAFAFRDRRNVTFCFRVKGRTGAASERKTGTEHCVLKSGRGS